MPCRRAVSSPASAARSASSSSSCHAQRERAQPVERRQQLGLPAAARDRRSRARPSAPRARGARTRSWATPTYMATAGRAASAASSSPARRALARSSRPAATSGSPSHDAPSAASASAPAYSTGSPARAAACMAGSAQPPQRLHPALVERAGGEFERDLGAALGRGRGERGQQPAARLGVAAEQRLHARARHLEPEARRQRERLEQRFVCLLQASGGRQRLRASRQQFPHAAAPAPTSRSAAPYQCAAAAGDVGRGLGGLADDRDRRAVAGSPGALHVVGAHRGRGAAALELGRRALVRGQPPRRGGRPRRPRGGPADGGT